MFQVGIVVGLFAGFGLSALVILLVFRSIFVKINESLEDLGGFFEGLNDERN